MSCSSWRRNDTGYASGGIHAATPAMAEPTRRSYNVPNVERVARLLAAELDRPQERGLDVAHLHVEAHARIGTTEDVARRTGFRAPESGGDLHDRPVADVPVEEVAVERLLPFRIARH